MKCNIGKLDRVLRGLIGLCALAYGVYTGISFCFETISIVASAVGVIFLFTALIGWCPPYALFGINSGCKIKDIKDKEK